MRLSEEYLSSIGRFYITSGETFGGSGLVITAISYKQEGRLLEIR
jgi:hypothetical protein